LRLILDNGDLLCSIYAPGPKGSIVHPMEVFDKGGIEQRRVPNGEQVLCDKPNRLFSRHPFLMVEAHQVYRVGERT
jgi:hypothetical protein